MSKKRLTRWSYSAWNDFNKCAFAFYQKYVLGKKETSTSPALERGNTLHKKQEVYLNGSVKQVPREFLPFKPEYEALKRARPIVEQFWGVDTHWQPMDWGSWVVFKMDAAVLPGKFIGKDTLWIQDLKTGKVYDSHDKQASLGATIGRALYPKVKRVEVEFWYADQGIIIPYEFDKAELKRQRQFWTSEGDRILTPQKEYLPSPSVDNCKYCFLRSDNGGPCKAWKKFKSQLPKRRT